jgi:DNA-binding MarR family transcriptional regulator
MEEAKQKKSFWAFLPSMALADKSLSSTEKLILAEIYSLADENGVCYPSNRHFAELLGISEVQASRCVNNLKKEGWIDIEITPELGNQRVLKINLRGIDEKLKRSYQKVKEGSYQKVKDRNSYNRNSYRNSYSIDSSCIQFSDENFMLSNSNSLEEKFFSESNNQNGKIYFDERTSSFSGIEKYLQKWKEAYPLVDIEGEIKQMEAWVASVPRTRWKKDWKRFIVNWLSREQDRAEIRNAKQKTKKNEWDEYFQEAL